MIDLSTERLTELIGRRYACLVQLQKLGIKQTDLISSGEISSLLRLLGIKNQLIGALQSIERDLAPFHAQDPNDRQWSSTQQHRQCSMQIAECKQILDQVMRMEIENEARMTNRRNQIVHQLQIAHSKASVRSAYQAQYPTKRQADAS